MRRTGCSRRPSPTRRVPSETRKAFDEFVVDNRRIQGSIKACDDFVSLLKRSKLEHALDKDELIVALKRVRDYLEKLLQKLEGNDQPDADKKIKNSY